MSQARRRSRPVLAVAATVVVAASGVLVNAFAASASSGCSVKYAVSYQSPGAFGATVDVTNLGDALTSWSLTWTFASGQTITNLWNGNVTQAAGKVTVANASWNGNLGTGATASIGFGGTWTTSNPAPVDFALNGVSCTGGTGSTTGPTPSASTTGSPTAVLDQVTTVGRVREVASGVQFTWPGTYFEGRFKGTSIGVTLNDSNNDYVVQVDGKDAATFVTPGQGTQWVKGLADGEHTVRLAKRTESPWAVGEFDGLVAGDGGAILAKPAARTRQMEFIGDSWTAGYGDMSTSRDCNSNGGVTRNTNADVTFGALTAKSLNADYQINAWSGLGMVRNYGGQNTDYNFRTYYDTDLQALYNSQTWPVPASWRPQVVVIGLGINDFSTALTSGEKWTTIDELAADYRTAYLAFLDKLRARYGASTQIVLTYPDLSYQTTAFADSIAQIVKTRNDAGDTKVTSLYYDNNGLGMDLLGCDWHPSQHDHQILADLITEHLDTLGLSW